MKEAANSLLKVLEEPPEHTSLILLTENPQVIHYGPVWYTWKLRDKVSFAACAADGRHVKPPTMRKLGGRSFCEGQKGTSVRFTPLATTFILPADLGYREAT